MRDQLLSVLIIFLTGVLLIIYVLNINKNARIFKIQQLDSLTKMTYTVDAKLSPVNILELLFVILCRALTRAGFFWGVHIHIFVLCPANFF